MNLSDDFINGFVTALCLVIVACAIAAIAYSVGRSAGENKPTVSMERSAEDGSLPIPFVE